MSNDELYRKVFAMKIAFSAVVISLFVFSFSTVQAQSGRATKGSRGASRAIAEHERQQEGTKASELLGTITKLGRAGDRITIKESGENGKEVTLKVLRSAKFFLSNKGELTPIEWDELDVGREVTAYYRGDTNGMVTLYLHPKGKK